MATRMLIDATHEEETRVVVVKGNQVEEFDFETATRRPLKGNIYLARVTRVEPSLQAAFVDFGGNRHGFLAFSEIHPDYYQIPVADRERLKREEAAAAADDDEDDDEDEDEEDEQPSRSRHDDEDEAEADSAAQAADAREEDPADPDRQPEDDRADSRETAHAISPPLDDAAPDGPPTPSAALPERSGLRRVARLFGFGADEVHERGSSEAEGGQPTPAFMSQEAFQPAGAEIAAAAEAAEAEEETATGDEDEAVAPVEEEDRADLAGTDPAGSGSSRGGRRQARSRRQRPGETDDEDRPAEERDDSVEAFGGDAVDEVRRRTSKRRPLTRRYKIQEVIKRRQILLVQVVKEERGNKGAALTTYLSLAGRYCVLMPNSPNGGGISRKIVSAVDRKRLKAITSELDVPDGMGMIVRTAGMERNRAEIKRDFEFLLRTWDNIRELTLASMAPCLVYEEANLIKRAIRDLYNKDIDEILVEGENGYRHAKDFMKMLMPSHSKRVQPYKDRIPLFHRYQTEAQLDEMFFPTVQLRSGGYIVINATEALVAIDVNSGRSTKEHNIESTAYKTNMEAAEEVARQLRLRDMAGLIVIDFIDMDESRNARNVERKLKECLKLDRARIQVGRISSFGLLEMSRQRLRPSLVEQSMVTCPHCDGQGHVRSVESATIRAIRAAEDEGIRERSAEVTLIVPTKVAIYLLNSKRDVLEEIEGRYGMRILVKNDDTLGPSEYNLERSKTRSDGEAPVQRAITAESTPYREIDDTDDEDDAIEAFDEDAEDEREAQPEAAEAPARTASEDEDEQKGGRGRRRRRRRPRRGGEDSADTGRDVSRADADADTQDEAEAADDEPAPRQAGDGQSTVAEDDEAEDGDDADENRQEASADDDDGDAARRGRRRGRRGGRRRRRRQDREENGGEGTEAAASDTDGDTRGGDAGGTEREPAASDATAAHATMVQDDDTERDGLTALPEGAPDLEAAAPTPLAALVPPHDSAATDGSGTTAEPQATKPEVAEPEVAEPAEAAMADEPVAAEPPVAPEPAAEESADEAALAPEPVPAETVAPEPVAATPEEVAARTADTQPEAPVAAETMDTAGQVQDDAARPAPAAEPASGAVLSLDEYPPAAGPSADEGGPPRRGWWRRPGRGAAGADGSADQH